MQCPFFGAHANRATIAGAISGLALLAACSTDSLLDLRPSVDVGETGGIVSVKPVPTERFRETADGAFEAEDADQYSAPAQDVPAEPQYAEPEQQPDSYETQMSQPEPDYEDNPASLNGGDPSEQDLSPSADDPENYEQQASTRPIEPRVAGFPRMIPRAEPAISADEAACRRELKRAGVRYEDLASIRDSATCYINHPVKVSAIGNIQMKPAATLTCRMALTFAKWTNKELSPSVRWRYFTGVKTIRQGSSYSCRRIAGSGTPSAHSKGDALDLMAIEFNNGKSIDVKKQGIFSFRASKLLNNVRADGCEYFSTVLGPGYNYDHRDHFHFDLMDRKNGHKACH